MLTTALGQHWVEHIRNGPIGDIRRLGTRRMQGGVRDLSTQQVEQRLKQIQSAQDNNPAPSA